MVAKLLWVEKWWRPDIDPSVSFLCTRVTKSTKEDTAKLRQVLQYLKHTIDDNMITGADILSQLCTWVDTAYVVHPDLKIHTGGCVSFGFRMVHYKSSKQNINTKCWPRENLVGVSDYVPYSIWIWLFMGAQGYDIKQNSLFQDNQITINMEKTVRRCALGTPGNKNNNI